MNTNPVITDEMLSAYMAGNATVHETAQILRAAETDATIRETLQVLLELDAEEQQSVLPMMAMAADDVEQANRCAIRCEAYILRNMGIMVHVDELTKEAEDQGWLHSEGTPLYNIGRLSERYGMVASRRYECSVEDIAMALATGKQVIAVVDTNGDGKPNHSVVVMTWMEDAIEIFDPDTEADTTVLPLADFAAQWTTSHNYMVIISDAAIDEYEPHPIDLSDVRLDPEMDELREAIAENAHEVWAAARRSQGWTYGPQRSDDKKQTPDMVPYSRLTDEEKQYDRDMAENTIKLLKKLGWKIRKM